MKQFVKSIKAGVGFSAGFGLSLTFAVTMDDSIYADMKRNVIIPLQLSQIKGDGSMAMTNAGI